MSDDRDAVPAVAPVVIGGIRYEAPHMGGVVGVDQDGGVLAAFDDKTGGIAVDAGDLRAGR